MKKYRFLSLLLALPMALSLFLPASAIGKEDLNLFCTSAALLDANHNDLLYDMNARERAYPASITKVMTALLVMEAIEGGQLSMDTVVTVSETAVQNIPPEYVIGSFKAGEQVSIKDLLYCMLLESDCDASNILAEAVDGTVAEFVAHMNRKAGELDCQGTHLTNTYGLHDENHYSTAYDITLWMKAALEYDQFREVIGTDRYTVPATNLSGERFFYNKNALISNLYYSGYYYDKCIGGKTGTTDDAGRCLVAAAEDGDELLAYGRELLVERHAEGHDGRLEPEFYHAAADGIALVRDSGHDQKEYQHHDGDHDGVEQHDPGAAIETLGHDIDRKGERYEEIAIFEEVHGSDVRNNVLSTDAPNR